MHQCINSGRSVLETCNSYAFTLCVMVVVMFMACSCVETILPTILWVGNVNIGTCEYKESTPVAPALYLALSKNKSAADDRCKYVCLSTKSLNKILGEWSDKPLANKCKRTDGSATDG